MRAMIPFPEISPEIFSVTLFGMEFALRWYALAYIVGIVLAWQITLAALRRPALWQGNTPPMTKAQVEDLLTWIILGIILGGRFGYVLFYMVPYQQDVIAANPLSVLKIWDGGMSFHGGLIGVTLAIMMIARRRKLSLLPLGDIAGVVAPIGIMFGRLANFINAELYGRKTDSALGVIFPEGYVPGSTPSAYDWVAKQWVYTGQEFARHPSQLYEAALEGLLPVVVASLLIWKFGALKRPGLIAGLFLLMYGTGRSVVENFRLPDSFASDLPFGLTMGMILSTPMMLIGVWLIWRAWSRPPVDRAGDKPAS